MNKVLIMDAAKGVLEAFPHTVSNSISPKIGRVLTHIELYYASDLKLKDVAALFGIHPAYLCRRFKKDVGISFHEYILRIRLQTAISLLIHSEQSIKEVCYTVGFNRPEIFSKAFKRFLGCSPTNYRVKNLASSEKSSESFSFAMFTHNTAQSPGDRGIRLTGSVQVGLNVKK